MFLKGGGTYSTAVLYNMSRPDEISLYTIEIWGAKEGANKSVYCVQVLPASRNTVRSR